MKKGVVIPTAPLNAPSARRGGPVPSNAFKEICACGTVTRPQGVVDSHIWIPAFGSVEKLRLWALGAIAYIERQ
jgi:hypothetical protein